jgi:predicted glycoside hydrolase/deacetylase ChbG (UPF0249 family)
MPQIINIHADDWGISDEITDNILDCINNGIVNSISIVNNTNSFDYSMNQLKNLNKDIRLNLHLNLVEGFPITSKSEIPNLINKNGEFKFTFLELWLKYLTSSIIKRKRIRHQIKTEIECQIKKYCNHFNNEIPLRIDSHMHFHMIPFVFDVLLELSEVYKIEFIRIPRELRYYNSATNKNYLSSNLIKNVLLNCLAKHSLVKLKKRNIQWNQYFIGVLATGDVSIDDIDSALKTINKKGKAKSVDILFHPGGVKDSKSITWTNKKMFLDYYSSINRKKESNVLKNPKTKEIILHYENIFNN